jgi:integrase
MTELNPLNERLKLAWIEELTITSSDSTIDHKLAALSQFEALTDMADFAQLDRARVDKYLAALRQTKTSAQTKAAKVRHVKAFYDWMVMDERLKPKSVRKAILALRLKDKEARAGRARRTVKHPTLAEVEDTIRSMPEVTSIDLRNRALLAFTALSGARDGAIISLKLKHVRWAAREVEQHPDEVDTKAGKMIQSWFFPVGDFIEGEGKRYLDHLKADLGFGDDDPLFPAPLMRHDEADQFKAIGLSKRRWTTAEPMRKIFRAAFTANGLRYYNPHSFRNMLMALAYERKLDPESLKAWSQNLGHEHLDTSFNSYGQLDGNAQRRAMLALKREQSGAETVEAMVKRLIAETNRENKDTGDAD